MAGIWPTLEQAEDTAKRNRAELIGESSVYRIQEEEAPPISGTQTFYNLSSGWLYPKHRDDGGGAIDGGLIGQGF